ncbi:MAG: DUF4258 domain-containing protein [Verrucomicrobiota bacterium]|jgi:hypothetical protein
MHENVKFHLSRHAALRLAERKIPLEYVKNVIHYADREKRLQNGTHGGILKRFTKTDGSRILSVVAEIKQNECWLATAYYED